MINIKSIIVALVILVAASLSADAQKYGYINSALLLSELPEIKEADKTLEVYQKQKIAQGENMVKKFQEEYQAVEAQVARGELSQLQIQQKESELAQKNQEIQNFQQQIQNELAQKREQLYQPILDDVKAKVDAYAQSNGYAMIFDSSGGGLLFAQSADDLSTEIKAALGL